MRALITILKLIKKLLFSRIIDVFSVLLVILVLFQGHVNDPMIVFMDIGQGDAILVQQGRFQMLVDGGGDISVLFEIAKYMPITDREIEIVVLTHPHADHLMGLLEIFDRYDVGEVWVNTVDYDLDEYAYFKGLGLNFREVSLGESLLYKDLHVNVLYPVDKSVGKSSNINNESIVIEVEIAGKSIYLMGDAEKEVEEILLGAGLVGKGDILKVGHHCSRTATSRSFLEALGPSVAVCSFGRGNKFGHPHSETLEMLAGSNVQYMVTGGGGNLVFRFK